MYVCVCACKIQITYMCMFVCVPVRYKLHICVCMFVSVCLCLSLTFTPTVWWNYMAFHCYPSYQIILPSTLDDSRQKLWPKNWIFSTILVISDLELWPLTPIETICRDWHVYIQIYSYAAVVQECVYSCPHTKFHFHGTFLAEDMARNCHF